MSTIILSKSDEKYTKMLSSSDTYPDLQIEIWWQSMIDKNNDFKIFSVFLDYQFFVSYIIDHIRFLETNSNP